MNILGTVPLVNGVAALTVSSLSVGTHTIQAYYHGDATHDSKYSVVLSQAIVNKPTATISLSSSMNPGSVGDSVQRHRNGCRCQRVSGCQPAPYSYWMEARQSATVNLTNGVAQFPVSFTTAGTHPLTAVYSGDTVFAGATSAPLSEVIKNTIAFYVLGTTPSPSVVGTPVTFSASLTQSSATGTVEFVDSLATPPVSLGIANVVNGTASLTTSSLPRERIRSTSSTAETRISWAPPPAFRR